MPIGGESSEIDRLASRLRLLAAELADDPAESRAAHLNEEVERMLAGRSAAERTRLLEELRRHFPAPPAPVEAREAAPPAPADASDPEAALRTLEAEAASMSEADRRQTATRLARAGLQVGARVGWSPEAEQGLRSALGLGEGDEVDADRAIELAAILTDAIIKLDRAAWSAWHELSPRSRVRRRAPLDRALGGFVRGDEDASQTRADVERTRILAALLVGSTGNVGKAAWDHVRHVLPGEIEMDVGRGKHRRLWTRYEELASEHLTAHALDQQMRSFVARFVEEVMGGRSL